MLSGQRFQYTVPPDDFLNARRWLVHQSAAAYALFDSWRTVAGSLSGRAGQTGLAEPDGRIYLEAHEDIYDKAALILKRKQRMAVE